MDLTLKKYSVLLIYPDYLSEDYPRDTYFAHVEALEPRSAISIAQKYAAEANADESLETLAEDFLPILCLDGHHQPHHFAVWNP